MAKLYNLSLDELIEFDIDLKEIEQTIENTNEEKESKIDLTSAWSKKYPVLATYQMETSWKEIQNFLLHRIEMLILK